jgi:plastocyanin
VVPTERVLPSPTEAVPTVATASGKTTQKATVDYTDKGFSPKSITVKMGTTVTWTNKGKESMWVASAPHPAHTDLPGFDELKGATSGGIYSYTFAKVGNWKYHNHLKPADTGVVVVTN